MVRRLDAEAPRLPRCPMADLDFGQRPNIIPWPPLIYVGALAIAAALQYWIKFINLDALIGKIPVLAGVGLMVAGAGIDLVAMITLRRRGTTVLPHAGSKELCTTGIYGLSRNPIYLGNSIAMAGLAAALGWSWLLLLVPVVAAAVTWLAIAREEEHLSRRFGGKFKDYCAHVRRWL